MPVMCAWLRPLRTYRDAVMCWSTPYRSGPLAEVEDTLTRGTLGSEFDERIPQLTCRESQVRRGLVRAAEWPNGASASPLILVRRSG